MKVFKDVDGKLVVNWLQRAKASEKALLITSEYSDDQFIYTIDQANDKTLTIKNIDTRISSTRPYELFTQGVFSIPIDVYEELSKSLRAYLTESEQQSLASEEVIQSKGFSVLDVGGNSSAVFLATLIRRCEASNVVPTNNEWTQLHEVLKDSGRSGMIAGIALVSKWVVLTEKTNGGYADLFRRVLLTYLYRHTGQLHKAVEVSDVVDRLPKNYVGGPSSLSVLCTIRAATFMDLAEANQNQCSTYLRLSRVSLNRANATSGENSEEIRQTYMRLKRLDAACLQNLPLRGGR